MSQPLLLNLRNLACGYGDQRIVQNLNLHLNAGDIGCLLGSSGCGKTTTLRAIAGFEPVHDGEIQLAGEVISRAGFTRAPEKRRIGMVFQDYALFPHLTVAQNVAFGIAKHPRQAEVIEEMLELVKLGGLGGRYPHELSGGQQQQLAIGRALASRPRLLILDEPTEGIQPSVIKEIGAVIRRLAERGDMAILLVEQFYDFAEELADQYLVMARGEIIQRGRGENMQAEGVRGLVTI